MDRINPFSRGDYMDDDDDEDISFNSIRMKSSFEKDSRSWNTLNSDANSAPESKRSADTNGNSILENQSAIINNSLKANPAKLSTNTETYSTSFPDPFGDKPSIQALTTSYDLQNSQGQSMPDNPTVPLRSNSVTFSNISKSVDDPIGNTSRFTRQASGLSSFLSRATSVTSTSVTDRVQVAVGSVRSAVDSLSSQIQSAVPSNLNDKLNSTAIGSDQAQQSTASYLAAKLSSATGQFTSSSAGSLAIISRQRVILILENSNSIDWAQQFSIYRRMTSEFSSTPQSKLTYLFNTATSQLAGGSGISVTDNTDLIEQADFRDVSILANQSSSTATIYMNTKSKSTGSSLQSHPIGLKIIRPDYVVIRQKTKENLEQLKSIVKALNYCLVPMFEPLEIWTTFQDRQLTFAKLLKVQRTLGKENFPLIPQIYFQTHNDLLNYIDNFGTGLPCLVRFGQSGKGKMRIDSMQMLQDFTSIMEVSGHSCTIEQYLSVKYDLIIQKIGTSLKLFRRQVQMGKQELSSTEVRQQDNQFSRQPASRQTSLSSSIFSNLMSTGLNQQTQRQTSRRNSTSMNYDSFERISEVSSRYRKWMEAIAREFENKIDAFSLKIAVADNDREYIIGLTDCTTDFLGTSENQEEDKQSFIELIMTNINTIYPNTPQSTETIDTLAKDSSSRRGDSDDPKVNSGMLQREESEHIDKRKIASQSQISQPLSSDRSYQTEGELTVGWSRSASLTSSSKSVPLNQYRNNEYQTTNESSMSLRRSSDLSGSCNLNDIDNYGNTTGELSANSSLPSSGSAMGQSFLNRTSTAFNSLQRHSSSFFKRLDSRTGDISNTPPQSAKSDKAFDRNFRQMNSYDTASESSQRGFKSQSIDSPSRSLGLKKRPTPPKPPPPQLSGRQSSLAAYSTNPRPSPSVTPNSTPVHSRQNSKASDNEINKSRSSGVRRQNSALSAFEPFDSDLASHSRTSECSPNEVMVQGQENEDGLKQQVPTDINSTKRASNFDSASITSGDSSVAGEDTMNNIKKTFASIFGDKLE